MEDIQPITEGEKDIVPPPKILEALDERLSSGRKMVDFYLAKKKFHAK